MAKWNESSKHFSDTNTTLKMEEYAVTQLSQDDARALINKKLAEKDQAWFDWQEITTAPRGTSPVFYTWTEKGRKQYAYPN